MNSIPVWLPWALICLAIVVVCVVVGRMGKGSDARAHVSLWQRLMCSMGRHVVVETQWFSCLSRRLACRCCGRMWLDDAHTGISPWHEGHERHFTYYSKQGSGSPNFVVRYQPWEAHK